MISTFVGDLDEGREPPSQLVVWSRTDVRTWAPSYTLTLDELLQ